MLSSSQHLRFHIIAFLGATILSSVAVADEAAERVTRAKSLLTDGKTYDKGCSGFVSEVLKIEWQDAKALMGTDSKYVGKDNDYEGLKPGDIVGWSDRSPEHVAIFIGEKDMKFIDVKEPSAKPRAVKAGYGPGKLFKSSKY